MNVGRSSWSNWSRTVRCEPARLLRPVTEEQICELVRTAGERDMPVRAAGSGHSFNAAATTDGILLDTSAFTGIEKINPDTGMVTVRAGTSLNRLNRDLWRAGWSLSNMGTLAEQTVAGAIATGNHGTGLHHPPFSGLVESLRMVTADGIVRNLDMHSDPEVFRCARISLGVLGVITSVTLRSQKRFHLRVTTSSRPLDSLLARFDEWVGSADHVAFSFYSWSDTAVIRTLQRTGQPVASRVSWRRYRNSLHEVRCSLVGQLGRYWPGWVPRLLPDGFGGEMALDTYVDASYRVFTFPQPVRFLALEHAIPLETVPEAVSRLRQVLRQAGRHSPYSVLIRVSAADDAPLSPAYGHPTGYVNITVPRTAAFLEVLHSVEDFFSELGARPHWGKAHSQTAATLAERYPEWATFQRVRAKLDPRGRFRNNYTDRVLGAVRSSPPAASPRGGTR